MPKLSQNAYDAVIIGAGIGGLVCGCYLAKAGMKVLIAEQHYKPGGYCTSFKRQGFMFDAAAHCFGGFRKEGITRKVFEDLDIIKRLRIVKNDPSDTIITPDYKVSFHAELHQTVHDIQSSFPNESHKVKKFFSDLIRPAPNFFTHMRSWTFKELLDKYFSDDKLKTILCIPLLGVGGLPSSRMSAFIGSKLFSEFLLDGGYYPEGGMQMLPTALAERFTELGGNLLLSTRVKKIRVKDGKVTGVVIEKGMIPSKCVVSNCDARQTFLQLLDRRNVEEEFYQKIKTMVPSISSFVAYLGVEKNLRSSLTPGTSTWFLSHYDLNKGYEAAQAGDIGGFNGYMLRLSPDKTTLLAMILAPYKNKDYWINRKSELLERFINIIEKYSIPLLTEHIIYKDAATPYTLHRYTANYKGAAFGWEGVPSQLAVTGFKKPSFIKGMYLTGHWTTHGLGISGVVYVGYDTAKILLRHTPQKEMAKIHQVS
jgi:phytoene dehydrogenase-like protein